MVQVSNGGCCCRDEAPVVAYARQTNANGFLKCIGLKPLEQGPQCQSLSPASQFQLPLDFRREPLPLRRLRSTPPARHLRVGRSRLNKSGSTPAFIDLSR